MARAVHQQSERLEWLTLLVLSGTAIIRFLFIGESQTMLVATIEEALEVLPAIGVLATLYLEDRPPTPAHPYGFHRIGTLAFAVAAVVLLGIGIALAVDSATVLLAGQPPDYGTLTIGPLTLWRGWAMTAVLLLTGLLIWLVARVKFRLAEAMSFEAMETDAKANIACLYTSVGGAVGILLTGAGLWWADPIVALLIALEIVRDGWEETRAAAAEIIDRAAEPETLARLGHILEALPQVQAFQLLTRKSGRYLVVDAIVVPRGNPSLAELDRLRQEIETRLMAADPRIHHVFVVFRTALPPIEHLHDEPGDLSVAREPFG